ncbi:MAG TPA: hypothetical protein VL860_03755, partial [Planctomycetota bacterium]|nr:hypothetical protein [Planctomycetota bacterium]
EIGGLNQLKRQVPGVYEEVFLSADDQYLILARTGDFAVVEATGNTPPKAYADQRLLAIDAPRDRILCGKDHDLSWLYWKTSELVKIASIETIWKNAQGAQADDPAPRLPQIVRVFLLNDGHCALQLQDGSVLYFDVNAPQHLSDTDIQLRDKLRDEIRRDEGK